MSSLRGNMINISFLALLIYSAGLLSVSHQNTLILKSHPGDNVTIWYNHSSKEPAYINWFRHQNLSVPDRLACQYYKLFSSVSSCFVLESNRIMMSVNSESTSLIITGVNYSDSGLYYCSLRRSTLITFSNATYLLVTERNETLIKKNRECPVFFILTIVFGAVIGILISVLLIILGCRKQCSHDAGYEMEKEERDEDRLNYAALQFSSKKRTPRHREDLHVVYSSVKR